MFLDFEYSIFGNKKYAKGTSTNMTDDKYTRTWLSGMANRNNAQAIRFNIRLRHPTKKETFYGFCLATNARIVFYMTIR